MGRKPLQLFPALPRAIEDALRASIQRFGVLVPVVKDQHGRILDGHHRARIAEELDVEYRVQVYEVGNEEEAREIAVTLNADRRQLTPEQRQEIAVALRQEGHSLRAIGGALGVSHTKVANDLSEATVKTFTVEEPQRIVGLDGKSRPARRLAPMPQLSEGERAIVSQAVDLLAEGKTLAEIEQQLTPPKEAPLPTPAQARKLALSSHEAGEPTAYLDNTGHWQTGISAEELAARSAVYSQSRALLNALEAFSKPFGPPEALLKETPAWWEDGLLQALDGIIRYIAAYAQLLQDRKAQRQEATS